MLDKTHYSDNDLDARLWIRELFITYQTSSSGLKAISLVPIASLLLTGICLIQDINFNDAVGRVYRTSFVVYETTLVIALFFYNFLNLTILFIAYEDARRRNWLMKKLTNSLELFIITKDSVSVRFPTLNFLCPNSILTLINARKVVLEIGSRFQIRIQIYISFFLVADGISLAMLFAIFSGLIDYDFS